MSAETDKIDIGPNPAIEADRQLQAIADRHRQRHDGSWPDGYRMVVASVATGEEIEDASRVQRTTVKYRAIRTDGTWEGPWRNGSSKSGYVGGAEGQVIGDAWKRATNSKDARIDEAGKT